MSNNDAVIGCRCCECQGIKCMFWHPGHSCRTPYQKDWVDKLVDKVNNKIEKKDQAKREKNATKEIS